MTIDRDPAWREAWADAVVRAALSGKEANAHRAGMVREARQRFLWSTVAKQWAAVFEEGLKNPNSARIIATVIVGDGENEFGEYVVRGNRPWG